VPRKFTRGQLASTALELADEKGLDALSMRTLAARLGTGPMTLYNYVDGRDGLESLVIEAVVRHAAYPPEPAEDWRDEVRTLAESYWTAIRRHPQVIPLMVARRTADEPTIEFGERLLEALARSGRAGRDLLVAFRLVTGFIVGFAQNEAGADSFSPAGGSAADVIERGLALPAERYPRVVEIATASARGDRTEEFRAASICWWPGSARRLAQHPPEQIAQQPAFCGGELLEGFPREIQLAAQPGRRGSSLSGGDGDLDPAVGRVGSAFDQAARLQAVDYARHIRRLALEVAGELPHRCGLACEQGQDPCLRPGQRVLGSCQFVFLVIPRHHRADQLGDLDGERVGGVAVCCHEVSVP
jgi:AcrR family transcriptional regulator